jgi:hypothetical protein
VLASQRHAGQRSEDQDRQPDIEHELEQPASLRGTAPAAAPRGNTDEEQGGNRREAPVLDDEF